MRCRNHTRVQHDEPALLQVKALPKAVSVRTRYDPIPPNLRDTSGRLWWSEGAGAGTESLAELGQRSYDFMALWDMLRLSRRPAKTMQMAGVEALV